MALRKKRVLAIDDDDNFREALNRWLEALGYEPVLASSAEEGFEILENQSIDVVLLDLIMPGVKGHAVLREVNRSGNSVPIIVVSGSKSMDDVIEAIRRKAVDFLRKPFKMEDLSAALDRATESTLQPRIAVASQVQQPRQDSPPQDQSTQGSRATYSSAQAQSAAPAKELTPRPTTPGGSTSGLQPERKSTTQERTGQDQAGEINARPKPPLREAVANLAKQLARGKVELPVLDPGVRDLPDLLKRQDSASEEVVAAIGRDPSLTVSVLRLANSAAYSLGQPATTLHEACVRLGNRKVLALAMEVVVRNMFKSKSPIIQQALTRAWKCTFITARMAAHLASLLKRDDGSDIHIIALLHNVGELLFMMLLSDLTEVTEQDFTSITAQAEAYHEKFGDVLTRSWKMPRSIVQIAGCHHHAPEGTETEDQKIIRNIVLAAWTITLKAGFTYMPGQESYSPDEYLLEIGLPGINMDELVEQAKRFGS